MRKHMPRRKSRRERRIE